MSEVPAQPRSGNPAIDSIFCNPLEKTILALDLGTKTGWAVQPAKGPVQSGTQTFRPNRFEGGGMRYLRFTDWLVARDRRKRQAGSLV